MSCKYDEEEEFVPVDDQSYVLVDEEADEADRLFITVPNPDVLRAGIAHAEADLKHWNQQNWIGFGLGGGVDAAGQPLCGTYACLAGHILLASGRSWAELIDIQRRSMDFGTSLQSEPDISDLALEALGFPVPTSWLEEEVEETDRSNFEGCIFEFTYNWPFHEEVAYTRDALGLLKKRITTFTGITFDEEVPA